MILFVLDACAAARRYFPYIGTANIDQIFDYPSLKKINGKLNVEEFGGNG
jgi:hypothetical protein